MVHCYGSGKISLFQFLTNFHRCANPWLELRKLYFILYRRKLFVVLIVKVAYLSLFWTVKPDRRQLFIVTTCPVINWNVYLIADIVILILSCCCSIGLKTFYYHYYYYLGMNRWFMYLCLLFFYFVLNCWWCI